jgi:MFS family permease
VLTNISRRLPFYYGWIVIAVVFVTMAIGVNARTAFSLFFPPIVDEFGWNRGVTAGAFSFGFFVSALLSPTLGRLMDRRGPRVVIELGVISTGAGLLLAPLMQTPWQLYLTLGLLVGGGSVCLGYTGQGLFLPNWFVRKRGLAMGIAFSGVGVGSIVLFPWLQLVIERAGWRAACTAMGLLVLVLLVPLNLLLARGPKDLGLTPDGDAAVVPGSGVVKRSNIVDAAWAATDWTLARALRTSRFWWMCSAYFSALFAWYAVQVHQTKYLVEIGFDATMAAWALGAVSLAGVPGQIALGSLSDRIGREPVWALGNLGFVITLVALLAMREAPNPLLLYVVIGAQGALGYGLTSVVGAIPAELFEGKHFGSIFGTLMLAAISGGAAGPWVTGALYDATGGYTVAFATSIAMSLFSPLAIWLAAPRKVRAVAGRMARIGA